MRLRRRELITLLGDAAAVRALFIGTSSFDLHQYGSANRSYLYKMFQRRKEL
jgi:hypothetical protein